MRVEGRRRSLGRRRRPGLRGQGWWARRALAGGGLALTAAAVLAGGAGAAPAANPTLQFSYVTADSIQGTLNGGSVGATSASASVIPPGTYNVLVSDQNHADPSPNFQLSGPGVELQTDLDGGENTTESDSETLVPNSTYTFEDLDAPSQTMLSFSTSSATSTGGVSGQTTQTTTPAAQSNGGGGGLLGTSSTTPASSSQQATVGTLNASVAASGKLGLSFDGRTVTTLKPGRYALKVADRSRKAGFVLKGPSAGLVTATSAAFTGTRSETLELVAGQWWFAPSAKGTRTYFIVVA